MYLRKKNSLFNLWLNVDRDWDQAVLQVEMSQKEVNLNRSQFQAVKVKDLRKTLTKEKFDTVYALRMKQSLFYDDADFPGDVEERWIYMPQGKIMRRDNSVSESATLRMEKKDASGGMLKALTSEDGPFQPGLLVAGPAALHAALEEDKNAVVAPKAKAKAKNKGKKGEDMTPKTALESGPQITFPSLTLFRLKPVSVSESKHPLR